MPLYPGAGLLALALAAHGWRKGSLNTSGAIAAALSGYLALANDLRLFGLLLIVFYLTGSRASKFKASVKASLDDSHPAPHSSTSTLAGNRNAIQVLVNSGLAVVCSVLYRFHFGDLSPSPLSLHDHCILDVPRAKPYALTATYFFAVCCGDTLASELGILSATPPRLITTGRTVVPGTNGGVSLWGLVCSLFGGTWIGLFAAGTIAWQSRPCASRPVDLVSLIAWASAAGLVGSLLDSVLGATLQRTLYSKSQKRVVKQADSSTITVSGTPFLSNDAVNLISSCSVALGLAYYTQDLL